MAITTNEYVNISNYGQRYGLSKSLSNYTIEEILDYAYVAATDEKISGFKTNEMLTRLEVKTPIILEDFWANINMKNVRSGADDTLTHETFIKVIWLNGLENGTGKWSSLKIVTELDFTHTFLNLQGYKTSYHDISCYYVTNMGLNYFKDKVTPTSNPNENQNVELAIYPYAVFKVNEKYSIVPLWSPWDYGVMQTTRNNVSDAVINYNYFYPFDGREADRYSICFNAIKTEDAVSVDSYNKWLLDTDVPDVKLGMVLNNFVGYFTPIAGTAEKFVDWISHAGTYIYWDNKLIKPIITDGYVTGITEDLTTESDLDKYTGSTKHEVPDKKPEPPTPSGDENELDEQDHGLTGQGRQFATYYVMEQSSFNSFVSELHSDNIEDIFRPMDFIISLMEAPELLLSHTVVSSATHIKLGDYTTTMSANPVKFTWGDINLGSIPVERKNNNFLDYEPYTKLVLYVPFCGFTELPTDVVMGKEIVLWASFDIETGDLRVNIFCGGACITTMNGNASKFIPLTKDNAMLKFTNACLSAVSDVGSAVVGGAITGGVGAVSGTANALVNEAFNMQRNIVDYRKGNGTINAFYSPTKPCLYYYTPFVLNTDGYAKSTGFACNEYGTLGSFSGFTVCKNPHVEIQCTDKERNMIAELLESGVILPDSVDNDTE